MTSRNAAIAALALSVGCDPGGEAGDVARRDQALLDGVVTEGDPAVVAIVLASEPNVVRCTGTVIDRRVVLTAAHCGVQLDPVGFRVASGPTVAAARTVGLLDAVAHPQYDATATNDLALLLLAESASVAPAALSDDAAIAAPPPVALRLVGFGAFDAARTIDGRKREGRSQSTAVDAAFVTLAGDPALPCVGDSGGPVFVAAAGGEKLGAIVSRGDSECSSYAKATRVDAHLATFIAPFVAANKEGAAAEGQRCRYDEQCARGACLAAEDDSRLRFCSSECARDAECPAPMTCRSARCRHPTPSPGTHGGACVATSQCLDGECITSGVCARRCVGGRSDCPSGFACEHLGGIDFYCLAQPKPEDRVTAGGSGCTMSPGRERTPGSAGVLAALFVAACVGRTRAAKSSRASR